LVHRDARECVNKEPGCQVVPGLRYFNLAPAVPERRPHLVKFRTAGRWRTMVLLIGLVKLKDQVRLDWTVVGGEIGSKQGRHEGWAASMYDQCTKARRHPS
jgi:protein gp37